MKHIIPFLLISLIISTTTANCLHRDLQGAVLSAKDLIDDGTNYNYEYSICEDNVPCNGNQVSLCQEWADGEYSLGKFKSVSKLKDLVLIELADGDDIPGVGARSCNFTITCDKNVTGVVLKSVVYSGSGTGYNAVAVSEWACKAESTVGVIVVFVLIVIFAGAVLGGVGYFFFRRKDHESI